MYEASPLKIRDCAARGIPCILPYKDTDLFDLHCSEIITIPNTPENLLEHAKEVYDFIFRVRGKRISRHLLKNRIDYLKKEEQRLAFFETILSS